jgi:hypothetical protein
MPVRASELNSKTETLPEIRATAAGVAWPLTSPVDCEVIGPRISLEKSLQSLRLTHVDLLLNRAGVGLKGQAYRKSSKKEPPLPTWVAGAANAAWPWQRLSKINCRCD